MRKQLARADEEFQMFADYYKIYQDFYVPEDNDTYWEELMRTCDEFSKKYNTKFARELIFAYMISREDAFKLKNA